MKTLARWLLVFCVGVAECVGVGGLVLIALLGHAAFAQGAGSRAGFVQRSNFLKPGQYATQTSLPLFVDSTLGSDLNDCSGTGTSACASCQAAADLIPFLVNHPVTVDMAAGNYAGCRLMNHAFAPTDVTTGAYISIRGAPQTNFAVATGTATGTLTAVTTDAVGFHVVTDGTQTWTVNDASTRFFSLVTGTGAGQVCPIISNTATSATVSCTFSPAPVAGTTYAITTPSTIITSSVNSPANSDTAAGAASGILIAEIQTPRALTGFVNVQDIGISGAFLGVRMTNAISAQFVRTRLSLTNQTGFSLNNASMVAINNSVVSTGTGISLLAGNNLGDNARLNATFSYLTSGSTQGTVISSFGAQVMRLSGVQAVNTSATGTVFSILNGAVPAAQLSGVRLACTSASTNVAVRVQSSAAGTPLAGGNNVALIGTNSIETCGTGLFVSGLSQGASVTSTTTFLSNTLAVNAAGGGKVAFLTAVPTFTTNTTDINVDGTTSTRAAFAGLVPNSIVNLSFLSAVYLQP